MDSQYVITGIVVLVVLVSSVAAGMRDWHRSPRRFWTFPAVAVLGFVVAAPAGEVDRVAGIALLGVGAVLGLAIGAVRGGRRFTSVGADAQGRVVYRPSRVGVVAIIVVFALHYVANLVADSASGLQFVLTILLALGVGESVGWHTRVFLRYLSIRDAPQGPGNSADA